MDGGDMTQRRVAVDAQLEGVATPTDGGRGFDHHGRRGGEKETGNADSENHGNKFKDQELVHFVVRFELQSKNGGTTGASSGGLSTQCPSSGTAATARWNF